MGMMIFRPGQRLVIPGVQVFQPRVTSAAATWWDNNGAISGCVAAYAPKGAADLAASYINLANPGTHNAAPGVAPTFSSADGWTFDGSSTYLDTSIVMGNASAWSVIVRFSDVSTGGNGFIVGTNNGSFWGIQPNRGTDIAYWSNGFLVKAPQLSAAVLAIAGAAAYRNGTAETGSIGTASTAFNSQIQIAKTNSVSLRSGKIQALAIYSATLTAGEVATITTAMQAL